MTASSEPISENNVNSRDENSSSTETVTDTIERMEKSEIMADVRSDIDARFPFAIASVCSNLSHIDKLYREANALEEQPEFSSFVMDISDDFPLADRFAFAAVMFVSSMLLTDVDDAKSDKFYKKYADSVQQIVNEIPCLSGTIKERYPY